MDVVSYNEITKQREVFVPKSISYRIVKRMLDIVCSLAGLVVLAPVFAVTALAIKAEDGGTVLYKQKRIGKDKKCFYIYKFRSMRKDAEQIHEKMRKQYGCEDVSFKLKEDPRVTKVGKMIRKTNIDELPQLINIIKGDMSLVGPRPLPDYEFRDEQREYAGKYDTRYTVPQGLTCYWQVSDRASVEFEERMKMDAAYAKECSIGKDMILIVKTAVYTITGKAGY